MAIPPELAYRRLEGHPAWIVERNRIYRDFRFPSFKDAIAFVNQVAGLAEQMRHHPDITVHEWCFVRLELYSHQLDTLTQQDVEFALAVDAILEQKAPARPRRRKTARKA